MKKLSADWVCPVACPPIQNGVVVTDGTGKILAVERAEKHDPATVEKHHGMLVPGFVNTHCHLELSHMKGKVPTGTGLIAFISAVVSQRGAGAEFIAEAIERAEKEMLAAGIVAVGDISNTTDTFAAKEKGLLRYHTFVEMFDFLQEENAENTFGAGKPIFDRCQLAPGHKKTIVPHAPYSVSTNLFKMIGAHNPPSGATVSIHNQETADENALFMSKKGGFREFYKKFGVPLRAFRPTRQPSIYYAIENLNPANRTIFVHNTLTTREDIHSAHRWSKQVFWATCPNANLYIENRLPNYQNFIETNARVTIGTDSLTSNWQLSILEELKTIARFQSYVPLDLMLRWATLNGAEALGFEDSLGSLEVGKTPGVLLLEDLENGKIGAGTRVKRLV